MWKGPIYTIETLNKPIHINVLSQTYPNLPLGNSIKWLIRPDNTPFVKSPKTIHISMIRPSFSQEFNYVIMANKLSTNLICLGDTLIKFLPTNTTSAWSHQIPPTDIVTTAPNRTSGRQRRLASWCCAACWWWCCSEFERTAACLHFNRNFWTIEKHREHVYLSFIQDVTRRR